MIIMRIIHFIYCTFLVFISCDMASASSSQDEANQLLLRAANFPNDPLQKMAHKRALDTLGDLYHHLKASENRNQKLKYAQAIYHLIMTGILTQENNPQKTIKKYGIAQQGPTPTQRDFMTKVFLCAAFALKQEKSNFPRSTSKPRGSHQCESLKIIEGAFDAVAHLQSKSLPDTIKQGSFVRNAVNEWAFWFKDDYKNLILNAIQNKKINFLKYILDKLPDLPSKDIKTICGSVHDAYKYDNLNVDKQLINSLNFDCGGYYALGHKQSEIAEKIILFLKKEKSIAEDSHASEEELSHREEIINYYKTSGGECKGLSVLWVLGMRISDELSPRTYDRDDIDHFRSILKTLAVWDGVSTLSLKSRRDIDAFIQKLYLYQKLSQDNPLQRDDNQHPLKDFFDYDASPTEILSTLISDTRRGHPKLVFKGEITGTQEILHDRLQKVLRPGCLIFLNTYANDRGRDIAHQTAAYWRKDNQKLYYYDPNSHEGDNNTAKDDGRIAPIRSADILDIGEGKTKRKTINPIQELMKNFWKASNPDKYNPNAMSGFNPQFMNLRTMVIEIYQYDGDPSYHFPQEAFSLSKNDFKNLITQNDFARHTLFSRQSRYTEKDSIVSKLKQSLDANTLIEIIKAHDINADIKKELIRAALIYRNLFDIKARQGGFVEYLKNHYNEYKYYINEILQDIENSNYKNESDKSKDKNLIEFFNYWG